MHAGFDDALRPFWLMYLLYFGASLSHAIEDSMVHVRVPLISDDGDLIGHGL